MGGFFQRLMRVCNVKTAMLTYLGSVLKKEGNGWVS
jgi:hypothetical protein